MYTNLDHSFFEVLHFFAFLNFTIHIFSVADFGRRRIPVSLTAAATMSGTANKSGHATADLLCPSNPFGTGFPSAAVTYADSGCLVRTGAGTGPQQLVFKPLASFHCYDDGHYQFFQPQTADEPSRWQCPSLTRLT
jgi:hypothetical protein